MDAFHCVIQAGSEHWKRSEESVRIGDMKVPTLLPIRSKPKFSTSFESAIEAMSQLPRMFVELDGSFVWVIDDAERRFQLDGTLCDGGSQLQHLELKGTSDAKALDDILQTLDWPVQSVMFQWVQLGTYLPEREFRRLLVEDRAK